MVSRSWRLLPAFVASAVLFGCGGGNSGDTAVATQSSRALPPGNMQQLFRSAGLVYAAPVTNADNTISVAVLSQDGIKTTTTGVVPSASIAAVRATLVAGNLVDWVRGTAADTAVVASDPAKTFGVILRKGTSTAAQFDYAVNHKPHVHRR